MGRMDMHETMRTKMNALACMQSTICDDDRFDDTCRITGVCYVKGIWSRRCLKGEQD